MASSSSVAASSLPFSSSERRRKRYDVFISFRGEDTRNNFTSHLHAALRRKSIETYIDDRLHRGDVISETLIKAIEDSYVSLVVFSENYACSKWCLDELTKIVECKRLGEQVVIPVFYKIDPSHVRKQLGSYKSALARHEKDLKHNKNRALKWKAALAEAANLAGYDSHSHNFRNDYELVEQVVKDVMQKLNHVYPSKLRHLVGVEQNCVLIESLLTNNPSQVQIIGIWGMGGIGKTTLAAVLFAKLSSQYEGRCFLENVRMESKKHGLNFLRNKLLSELLEEEDAYICTPQVTSSFVLSRLNRRRSFIVLDDVNNSEQLEYLIGEHDCLGSGSRVIVTTRDKHVLSMRVDEIYEVKPLSYKDSLQLFSLNAFNKSNPERQLEERSMRVVHYAKGIPLALKVLGSFFRLKSKKEWDNALKKLQKIPNREIQDVLRLSYDELDDKDQDIFLDIACFLKGWDKDHVTRLLEGCNFYPNIGIRTLVDKALITISDQNTIEMHDLIQEMGWEIVRQESIKNPECRSRLCDPEEVYDVLKNNKGTNAIEGMVLNAYQFRDLYLAPDAFKKMSKLRFLNFNNVGERGNIYLPSGLKSLPDSLIYLNWWGCPLKSLPSTFCPEKLVKIHMRGSHVEKLWDGVQNLASLEVVDLAGSKNLLELPDLSRALNVEEIILEQCSSLHEVHPSILSLPKLGKMDLFQCKSLKSLKNNVPSRSLKFLRLGGCSSLREFSIMSTKIEGISLVDTAIAKSPLSVLLRKGLHTYIFEPVESLGKIPEFVQPVLLTGSRVKSDISILCNALESLRDLQLLDLDNCTFSELPETINQLELLYALSMSGSLVERLPVNIKHLSHLRYLQLNECKRLQCLPELPPSLLMLDARQCISLETVFTSTYDNGTSSPHNKAFFFFENCVKLGEDAVNSIVLNAHVRIKRAANDLLLGRTLKEEYLSETYADEKGSQICFYLPGGKLPDWFKYCSTQPSLTIEIPSYSRFFGFAFFVIIAMAELDAKDIFRCHSPGCEYSFEAYNGETIKFESQFNHLKSHHLISDHIYLWYDAHCYDKIVVAIKNSPKNYNPKFSFKFFIKAFGLHEKRYIKMSSIVVSKKELVIKSCGVHPIYASEDLTIGEKGCIKSNRSLEIHELESLPKITRQVICPPYSSGSWKQNESKGLKEILF